MKVKSMKGFTLAELLIVMAIVVVLAAVAVPTFGRQLETARETGDISLIRNAYTEALSVAILDGADGTINASNGSVSLANTFGTGSVTAAEGVLTCVIALKQPLKQTLAGWQYVNGTVEGIPVVTPATGTATAPVVGNNTVTFKFALDATSKAVELSNTAADPIVPSTV